MAPAPVEQACLVAALGIATLTDIQSRRIPNLLIVAGLAVAYASAMWLRGPHGALDSLYGMVVGGAFLLPLYALGAMGAGDVKLMAMVGAFIGPGAAISAAILAVLAGGTLAIGAAIVRGSLVNTLRNVRAMVVGALASATAGRPHVPAPVSSVGNLPYAAAIAAGTVLHFVLAARGVSVIG